MNIEEIKEFADPDAIQWAGFDEAVIGTDDRGRLVYDIDLMIRVLIERDEMVEDEALEYLDFNVFNSYVGDLTPIHVYVRV